MPEGGPRTSRDIANRAHITSGLAAVMIILASIACLTCAEESANAQTRESHQALPLFVDYEIKGRRFHVPEKYLFSRPRQEELGQVHKTREQFGFAFWLSDSQPSSVRGISLTTFWPKEPGRPSSGDSDFVVSAYKAQYVPPADESKEFLPRKRLHGALRMTEGSRTEDSVHGLTCYTSTHQQEHLVVCALPSNPALEVVLSSHWIKRTWPNGRPPNPLWQMELFSREDGLWVSLRFPENALSRWPDVVCRTLALVRSWQVPPGESRNGCSEPRVTSYYP